MALNTTAIERTDGDGMENVESLPENPLVHLISAMPQLKVTLKPQTNVIKSPDSLATKNAKLIVLKPSIIYKKTSSASNLDFKPKEPKFVPYEPYKAAVRPIIPKKAAPLIHRQKVQVKSRNESCSSDVQHNGPASPRDSAVTDELTNLKAENLELEKQLKLQVQINAELKNLLVAAVGEDMETRVNCLAEDKQHLAQKLINTAKTLSSHQEQVEWLASQCEVWRSKFLASSVMVEELARWKASLAHKISDGEVIMKKILEERRIVRKNLLSLHSSLVTIWDSFDLLSKRSSLKTSNVIDLSAKCSEISNHLTVQLLGCVSQPSSSTKIHGLPDMTDAERAANHMLKHPHPMSLVGEPDAACNAVVGAAVALHSQLYLQTNPPRIKSCSQCSGEMHLV